MNQLIKRLFIADLTPTKPPFSLGRWETGGEADPALRPPDSLPSAASEPGPTPPLSADLQANLDWLREHFAQKASRGLILHEMTVGDPPVRTAVACLQGMANWDHLTRTVLTPLLSRDWPRASILDPYALMGRILTGAQTAIASDRRDVVYGMLSGSAALLVDGATKAVLADIKGWAKRSVEAPKTEPVPFGPHEAFIEDLPTNLSLIRRRLRTPDLTIEVGEIGRFSRTEIAMVYLRSVANPKLVGEVRRRLASIDVGYVHSGTVEQFIEDRPFAPYPSILQTERPDRVAAQVAEGFVVILTANTPLAMILPASMNMFLHAAEDPYLRWPLATFVRLLRALAYLTALLLPGVYLAGARFHPDMIPTPLMMAISGSREAVPLPVVLEVMTMELAFEMIREASVRVPTIVGPTIGIVGGLILGQAAVQAGVISPIQIIITSATAIASFAIPNYSLQFATRLMRFAYILAGAFLGLYGVSLLFLAVAAVQGYGNSFGMPWLTPTAPSRPSGDDYLRKPSFQQQDRPAGVRPQDKQRQPRVTRTWAPKPFVTKEPKQPDDDRT